MNGSMFNQIMMFHAIVSEGSITKAAQKLEVASPSVSIALKSLEEQLGLPLFTRTTRKIELTEAGHLLYKRTFNATSELSFAVESVSDLSKDPSGKVSITMPRFVYQSMFEPFYTEFCLTYPKIELEISINDAAIDILKQGIDLGIRFGDRVEEGMVARALTAPMKEALFASPEYIAQHGLPSSPEHLEQHKMIQYRFIASNQLAPLSLIKDGETLTVKTPAALVVNDTEIMIDASIKGLGIGRIVEPMVKQYFDKGSLVPVLPESWPTLSGLYVYFHKNSQKAKRVRALIDFLLEKSQR
ncbi:LysR family transcriptional regulator [Vibrio paucivorans]